MLKKISAAFILSLFIATIGAFAAGPQTGGWGLGGNPRGGQTYAFFEAFPTSGAGTSGPCSTTAPTGAKGQALTFTRASNATCTKTASGGLATTGIANGDLVVLSSNQPRVEYDANGTLGLLVESARTNSCLRSEEFDNAVWLKTSAGGGSNASVTGTNTAVAPDGTTTAEAVTFAATTAAQMSGLVQQTVFAANTSSAAVYIKGQSGAGTTDLCVMNAAGSGYNCTACSFVSTSWTRCLHQNTTGFAGGYLLIGNASVYNGGTARSQADVYLWGAQGEQSAAYATSYIPTVAATVTRAAEVPYLSVTWPVTPVVSLSEAATLTRPSGGLTTYNMAVCSQGVAASNYACLDVNVSSEVRMEVTRAGAPARSDVGPAVTLGAGSVRLGGYQSSTTAEAFLAGVGNGPTTAGLVPDWTVERVYLGTWTGGSFQANGIISRVCVDPDPARCR